MGFKILDTRHSAPGFSPERYQVRAVAGTKEEAETRRLEQLAIANRKRAERGKPPLPDDVLAIEKG